MDAFTEMLRSWQNFYFMLGGASASLLGLMFVALSLGTHLVNDKTMQDMNHFVAPSIFYFVSGIILAAVMLVPTYPTWLLTLILVLGGVFGLIRLIPSVRNLISVAKRVGDFDIPEWIFQIILPVSAYTLLLLSALGLAINQWPMAFAGLALVIISLLLSAISNTWSLVIWIVQQKRD